MSQAHQFKNHIARRLAPVSGLSEERIQSLLEVPPDGKLGEYALPCFSLAKERRTAPAAIASEFAAGIGPDEIIEAVAAAGPYLNVRLRMSALIEQVLEPWRDGRATAPTPATRGRIVIDFSSPNIAKPLSIGHLRSTVLGNSLARIHRHQGFEVVGINHLGDWGTQFGLLIAAWRRRGDDAQLEADPIRHLVELYVWANGAEAGDDIKTEARGIFVALEAGDPDLRALWKRFRDLSLVTFQKLYDDLGVAFDAFTGEEFFNDKMDAAVQLFVDRGLTRSDQGALIVPLGPEGSDTKPALLRKTDGSTLYLTRDLAAALYRMRTYGPVRVLYVVGSPQRDHFRELIALLEMLDPADAARVLHVEFGQYRLKEGKMSTREGTAVYLDEVIARGIDLATAKIKEKNPELADQAAVAKTVALGAIVFGDLVNDRVKDIVFDWDKVLDFDGDTAPYVMFAHVRARGILRKAAQEGHEAATAIDPTSLGHEHERRLLVQLGALPEIVEAVTRTFKPHPVAGHLLDLARTYHKFCHDCSVLKSEPAVRGARLALTAAVADGLRLGLDLLGITAPDQM